MTNLGKFMTLALWFLLLAGVPSQGFAHGLGWQQDFDPTISLNFVFADGEPLAYGEVSIFSPDDPEFEYQKARADQNGFFSFRPNQSGIWKFSAVDGQGHKISGEINVAEAQAGTPVPDAQAKAAAQSGLALGASARPDGKLVFLGLSIILNLTLLALWRKAARAVK